MVLNKNKKDVVHSVNNNSGISLSGINMSNYFNDFFVDTIPNMIKKKAYFKCCNPKSV